MMAEHQLKKIRPLGKLEEISAVAHQIDFFTNTGLSVLYQTSQPTSAADLRHLIYTAVAEVIRLHPILFAVPVVAETKEAYWGRLPSIDIKQAVSFVQRSKPLNINAEIRDAELDTLLENQHNTSFKAGYGILPVWRLIILQEPGSEAQHQFTACFIAHHSLSDGTASQIFQNSFQKALCEASTSSSSLDSKPGFVISSNSNDPISPSLEELHPLPIPPPPPSTTTTSTQTVKEWTGNPITLPCKTRYKSLSLAPNLMKPFIQECKKHKVTSTAALPSLIANLLYANLPSNIGSLKCNFPVSLRGDLPPKMVHGKMGNYIDAFKVVLERTRSDLCNQSQDTSIDASIGDCLDSLDLGSKESGKESTKEIWTHALKIQSETRKYFSHTSPSGEAYTNIAFFKFIPDLRSALISTLGQVRGESFEVSNLGTFLGPENPGGNAENGKGAVWRVKKVLVSRCAYAAGGPLVVCVLGCEGNVGLGFTWQEGAVEDGVVEGVVRGVREFFEGGVAG